MRLNAAAQTRGSFCDLGMGGLRGRKRNSRSSLFDMRRQFLDRGLRVAR